MYIYIYIWSPCPFDLPACFACSFNFFVLLGFTVRFSSGPMNEFLIDQRMLVNLFLQSAWYSRSVIQGPKLFKQVVEALGMVNLPEPQEDSVFEQQQLAPSPCQVFVTYPEPEQLLNIVVSTDAEKEYGLTFSPHRYVGFLFFALRPPLRVRLRRPPARRSSYTTYFTPPSSHYSSYTTDLTPPL